METQSKTQEQKNMTQKTKTRKEKRMGTKSHSPSGGGNLFDELLVHFTAIRRTAEFMGLPDPASRSGRRNGSAKPVTEVISEKGEEMFTTLGLSSASGLGVSFFRRMVGNGLLCPVGGRPYRFTQEEVLRFLKSKEGEEAVLDYLSR